MDIALIATKLLVIGVIFVAVLRVGVFAKAKLGKHTTPVLGPVSVLSMAVLYPSVILTTLFHPEVFPSFFIVHVCGGTIVCSVIAKWVEDLARKDLEREIATSQLGE